MLDISTLGKKIIFKCSEKPLSKFNISQIFKKFSIEEREEALRLLIQNGLINEVKVPKPKVRRIPTYYLITEKGSTWLQNYLNEFSEK
jgi:DNA-binding PadR family transcriptional regulator